VNEARFVFIERVYRVIKHLILFIISMILVLPGLVIISWIGLVLSYKADKEREHALRSSSVKITGSDVVSSFKVKYGVVMFPVFTLLFTGVLWIVLALYMPMWDAAVYAAYFFFLWPPYCYIAIKFADQVVINFSKLSFSARSIFSRSRINQLINHRRELELSIRNLVDKFGPQLFDDFHEKRVVQKEQFDKETRMSELMVDAYGVLDEIGI
jgi:hypothetical protein